MANYTFRPAVREEVGLIIGLVGPSGSGKTYSAMRLAAGIAGDKHFAFIDTENRRGLHYADKFSFDYCEMSEPFRPDAYAEAIRDADKAGYPVIVVDSMSHEWAGVGGILDWQEEELTRMAGDNWSKREACKMASWIKPKMSHKQMMARLLQVRANLILCFRAEEKIKMVTVDGNNGSKKTEIVPVGWQPICEKNLPYELTVSMLLTPEHPGVPTFLKLQEQHKHLFPAGTLINEASGSAISAWAKGGVPRQPNDNSDLVTEASSRAKAKFKSTSDFKEFRKQAVGTDAPLKDLTTDQLIDLIDAINKDGYADDPGNSVDEPDESFAALVGSDQG